MHSISDKGDYFSCGMPDGDNTKSTIVYKNSLNVDAYTRQIEDKYGNSDIISLVAFIKKMYFTQAIKWICEVCGYEYYNESSDKPEVLKWMDEIYKMAKSSKSDEEDIPLQPIDENILKYYGLYQNRLFLEDGISLDTQKEFGYGYDLETHSISIPIRDELGTLVGVKARLYKRDIGKHENKYFYLFPCSKSKILYGLDKTMPYIKQIGEVIVCESEKGVAQLWSYGFRNAVAASGHKLSKIQIKKLTHLGVDIIIAYDKGIGALDNGDINKEFFKKEFNKFLPNQRIGLVFDKLGLLKDKESPMDNKENWIKLYESKIWVRG